MASTQTGVWTKRWQGVKQQGTRVADGPETYGQGINLIVRLDI